MDAIVEGSILRAGERVRIMAQLIHAQTDQHLWAKSYEDDMRDVLALQREVGRAIAGEIQVKLTPQERALLTASRRVDPAAHEAYLRGRHHFNRFTGGGFRKAIEQFEDAIARDPAYAPGYVGLAEALVTLSGPVSSSVPPREFMPRARAAAMKALEIDDNRILCKDVSVSLPAWALIPPAALMCLAYVALYKKRLVVFKARG